MTLQRTECWFARLHPITRLKYDGAMDWYPFPDPFFSSQRPVCRIRVKAWKPAGINWFLRHSAAAEAGLLIDEKWHGGIE